MGRSSYPVAALFCLRAIATHPARIDHSAQRLGTDLQFTLFGHGQPVLSEALAQFADRGILAPEGSCLGARYVAAAPRLADRAADIAPVCRDTWLAGRGNDVGGRPGADELRGAAAGSAVMMKAGIA